MGTKVTTPTQIRKIEATLDRWLVTPTDKGNVYKATLEVLEAVPEWVQRKTWDGEYHGGGGGWRYKDRRAAVVDLILFIPDAATTRRLWQKLGQLIRKLADTAEDNFPIGHAARFDLALQDAKAEIQDYERESDLHSYSYLASLHGVVRAYLEHQDLMDLMDDPSSLSKLVEELVLRVMSLVGDAGRKELEHWLWDMEPYVEAFLFHQKPVPQCLLPVAQYMIVQDEERLQREEKMFRERTQQLRERIAKVKEASGFVTVKRKRQ